MLRQTTATREVQGHTKMARKHRTGGKDRLSALPDATLTRILSHLPTDQSVRTSTLSSRWRRVFAAVPVVDFSNGPPAVGIDHKVSGALLSRDSAAPIRSFRVSGFRDERPSNAMIDQWIATAVFAGVHTLDLDLSQGSTSQPLCPHTNSEYEGSIADFLAPNLYTVPRRLFTHAALRHLRLVNCDLRLPEQAQRPYLGSLETLLLRRIHGTTEALQLLISGCPRLSELTLEECPFVTRVRLQPTILRSFTMRCCHSAEDVFINAPSLLSLEYKGSVPDGGFPLSVTNWGGLEALAMDICESVVYGTKDSTKIREVVGMMEKCKSLTSLRLTAQPKPQFFPYRARLPVLTRLELRGPFRNNLHITALAGIMKNTTNLEVLTLVIDPSQADQTLSKKIVVPKDLLSAEVKCFSSTLKRIHLVGYSRQEGQRRLAKLLLRKAVCADEMRVTFDGAVVEGSESEALLVKEMMGWWRNQRIKITFTR